jgi:hypothetical protein
MRRTFGISVFFLLLLSCGRKTNAPAISFYHWKSKFSLSASEKRCLQNNSCKKLYVKYFDVVNENGPVPVAKVDLENLPDCEIIPVVYVSNAVFAQEEADPTDLADKVLKLISGINTSSEALVHEVQFDCDWTQKTKEKYFEFLRTTKKMFSGKISATIRLHQIKYREKTGVPPVDEGILMYYNMGKISGAENNSIYDKKIAAGYERSLKDYPLKLNLALPLFSWGIQVRDERVICLLDKMGKKNFLNDSNFVPVQDNVFIVKNGCFKSRHYFEKNDRIKIESVTEESLNEIGSELSRRFIPGEIIFYDLDSINLRRYDENIFAKVAAHFN